MDLKNKKVLVIGLGKSGLGAVDLLEQNGAVPVLYDGNTQLTPEDIQKKIFSQKRHDIYIGDLPDEALREIDLAVVSPGVPVDSPLVVMIKEAGIKVWSEIELAFTYEKGMVCAITGTNGKTTTTTLVGEIMKKSYQDVFVVGNIGNAYTLTVSETNGDSITVAEVSSFQLETIERFRPRISAVLNITPDHLDRHHTMDEYIRVKKKVADNQREGDVCILNYEDEVLRCFGENLQTNVLFFSSKRTLERGVFLEKGNICYSDGNEKIEICRIEQLLLLGTHNYENIMAAAAIGICAGVPIEALRDAIIQFKGVEHRVEFVEEKNGVKFYNDSKGTNPDAAIKGIQAMNRPTVLIGGGYDKHSEYEEWIQAFDGKVKCLVLIGETKEKIAKAAENCGFSSYTFADTLEEAVAFAAKTAMSGDAVLLSPACASWDMYSNYEERGRKFKEYVQKI